jgi:hypothetical protein
MKEEEKIDWKKAWKEPDTLSLVGMFIVFIVLWIVF